MGVLLVDVRGHLFKYYDNGGSVHAPGGMIIGNIDERALDLYRSDSDAERARSENAIAGKIRAMALAWLDGRGRRRR